MISCKDLDVSSDYTLDFTAGCATQYGNFDIQNFVENFTTGASEETVYHRVTLEAPTSGSECIVTLDFLR